MKKEIIKVAIISALVGAITAGSISSAVAYNLRSNDVEFSPNDSAWKVNSVNDAIDDLYIKKTGDNYSTEERVVGTWIDGKPIYQKTITGTSVKLSWYNTNYTYSEINTPIQDADVIIKGFGITDEGILYELNVDKTRTSGKWTLFSFVGSTSSPLTKLTFQYTKTTDQAPEQNNQG